ncbi:MAG: VIT and VWA domain-containing protein [Planctomycetaceae bacterium]|nr:VIT and VWA domain-containing protein [Planctomycetaceae bacterium]
MKKKKLIALQSVQIDGTLNGLLLSVMLRQRYRNEGNKNQEMVYTFPLGYNAELMGMEAQIGEKRLQATVFERKIAREKYEDAVVDGDSPILVEKSADGLYTANLGNVAASEEVIVEIRYAQLLRFEQGQIRLSIPTVIAQRYGDASAYLAPHESVNPDIAAEYPLTLHLDLSREFSQAKIASPSHSIGTQQTENGVSVNVEGNAFLDRDFILTLEQLTGTSFAQLAHDGEQFMAIASFCPKLSDTKPLPIALKILVDCSGSMGGDSINAAKRALRSLVHELNETDYVSYSRFGSGVQRSSATLQQCTADAVKQLDKNIQATDADLGGTEMEAALLDTFKIGKPKEECPPPFVLLITDGEIWNTDNVIAQCIKSGHRIFAIGVGSSSAENLLRQSAEKTGGACEFVAPREDVTGAILRMFHRMRGSGVQKTKVEWDVKPVWQSAIPQCLYSGETLHVAALFDNPPTTPPTLTWETDGQAEKDVAVTFAKTENSDVARLGSAKRLLEAKPKDSLSLALKYQLVCDQTAMFLVYERAEKLTDLPELHQVPQMHAAGWGGMGSVMESRVCSLAQPAAMPESLMNRYCYDAAPLGSGLISTITGAIKNFLTSKPKPAGDNKGDVVELDERRFVLTLANATASCSNVDETRQRITEMIDQHAPQKMRTFLAEYQKESGIETDVMTAVLLEMLYGHYKVNLNRAVKQWLRSVLKNVNTDTKDEIVRRYGTE